ncbi:3-methyl-2-oxobutanoate dehydrogenase subunit VorB [Synergistales bacterium]|nr:3-methyl-2-oxobutanoate dehydrogenase subunit VorB [Synergistales bacterium]
MSRIFMKGNEAIAEAAIRAGCRFFAGYPITPQNEIPEYMSKRLSEVNGSFVQGESEVASINMVFGAASVGTKALTSSSSPGISLKTEAISALAGAELPAVIVNVTRGGPGLGSIQAAQMDYLQSTKAAGHGGFKMLVYAPSTAQEAVDLTYLAFDKAEQYMAPMMLCPDGCIGNIMEPVILPEMRPVKKMKISTFASKLNNPKHLNVTTLLAPEENQERFNIMMAEMYERWESCEKLVEEYWLENAEIVIVAYGVSARIAKTAIHTLREQGINVGMIRPVTIWPFPYDSFEKLDYNSLKGVLCVEMSIPCQVIEDVRVGVARRAPISTLLHSGGILIASEEIVEKIQGMAEGR